MRSRTENTVSSWDDAIMCPHCGVNAQHMFIQLSQTMKRDDGIRPILEQIRTERLIVDVFNNNSIPISILVPLIQNCEYNYYCSQCIMCHDLCIWQYNENDHKLLHPKPLIHKSLPEYIKENISTPYEQARIIASDSPPAACMLLRLCLERICEELGVKKQKLVCMIEDVSRMYTLMPIFKKHMNVIRTAGNISAHDDLDNKEINFKDIKTLILLTYSLVEHTIGMKNDIDAMHKKISG